MYSYSLLLAILLFKIHSISVIASAEAPLVTAAPTRVIAKRQTPILSTLQYAYTGLPYQVYPFQVLRGPQFGFNQCNSTTLGPNSNCQTLIFNGPDDFCLWGSPDPNGQIGSVEAKVVAYCTKPYHGTRLIPPDAITGLQWIRTSAYIQVTGFIKNSGIGLDNTTGNGGELDPHGADLQGNPLGGVVYSNGTKDSDGHSLVQVMNWNTFVGDGQFCFKACFNSVTSPDYCENRYDLVGCAYNMPSAVKNGEFTECDSDLQDVVGVVVNGSITSTWSMPDPLTATPPYQPRVPASSNCKTHHATDLFLAMPTSSSSSSTSARTTGSSVRASGASVSGSTAPPTNTGSVRSSASRPLLSPAILSIFVGLSVGVYSLI
ncbi:hypothetical protein CVT25_008774 [Psilocybe cyanescens]|uniref:Macrofage activating glycoprotein n=1 Tax=Psilocybe cyanescens TaxID=93625 RepID=A0A409XMY2_PSICY|nr:hypothetical protein CVT25_008774 [Psilocybe cyanescens]